MFDNQTIASSKHENRNYTMPFNFDQIISRRHTNSYKWDSAANDDIIPLWVADMDFSTAPCVRKAIEQRAAHGVFGYTHVPRTYYDAITSWFGRRHGWNVSSDSIIYTTGVVPAISAIVKAVTMPGDKVLVLTPVYNCFFSSIKNNGCMVEESELQLHGNRYEIDFADFERRAADPRVTTFLLCNPHNPACRVWTRNELLQIAEICKRHNVFVISDEIHCELVFEPHRYTPFGSLGCQYADNAAICTSPSKAFNIAGLQIANISATNAEVRRRIDRAININEVCDVNPFGVEALMAAYTTEGEDWLKALLQYIHDNYLFATNFIKINLPHLNTIDLEGTYLLWVDCRAWGLSSDTLEHRLLNEAHVWLNSGTMYGTSGEGFMRINLACPRTTLAEGLQRIKDWQK